MADQPDYDALAQQNGALSSSPANGPDYDALAKQSGALFSVDVTAKAPRSFGSALLHAPGELLQGIGSGVVSTGLGAYNLARKIPGVGSVLPEPSASVKAAADPPNSIAGKAGKFLEQGAEFAVPGMEAADLTKGAGLLARAGGQAAVGGGVSALQSGGDPASIATGAVLGGGAELAGAAAGGVKALLAEKAPTLANFAESFGGATPTQKARISKALDMLKRDGITPPDSVHETQDIVKSRLDDLTQAYQNLDPAIRARGVDPADVVAELRKVQGNYMRRGVVTDPASFGTVKDQIKTVQDIAAANGGQLNVDDLLHMKQGANGRTNWQSQKVEQSLWNHIGDAYRNAADALAPETTPLNRDFQRYKDLEQIIDKNINEGKGTTPSGLSALATRAAQRATGSAAGAATGYAVAGPVGAGVGSIAGGIIGPKVGKAAAQAIQNAVDSGAFAALSPVRQSMIRTAGMIGDNAAILKMLGTAGAEESAVTRPPATGDAPAGHALATLIEQGGATPIGDKLPYSEADLDAGALSGAIPVGGPAALRALPPSAWILPGGIVKDLAAGETHGNAVMRLLGKATGKSFDPLAQGWLRQAGDAVQTGDLRNPDLGIALDKAAAASGGKPVFVQHPGGAIEVPRESMGEFLARAAKGFYSRRPAAPMQ